jgi:magnesium-transporting ATPase (P-type)
LPLALAILEGVVALALVLGVYWTAVLASSDETQTRLLSFTAVIIANLSLIFFARSGGQRVWRHIVAGNRSLWLIVLGTVAGYFLVVSTPLRDTFRMSSPTAQDAGLLALVTIAFWAGLAALHLLSAAARRYRQRTRREQLR